MEEEDTRGISFTIQLSGEAEIDLEDIVGDVPLEGVDQDDAIQQAEDALEGCELSIEIDGLPFMIRLHTK
jgi:hypothetical protein